MAASGSCSAVHVSGTVFFLLSAHEDVQITLQTGLDNTTFSPAFYVFSVPCSSYKVPMERL